MSSKLKYIIGLFLSLLIVTGIVYFNKSGKSSMADSSRDFAIEDIEDIGKIFVTDREGNHYSLDRKGNVWYADSVYLADPGFVDVVLTTLKRMTVVNLVPKPAIKNVMRDIATLGKKVEIYDRKGRKLRSFYIGGTNQRVTASYMVLEGYNIPYEMSYPGFSGDLGGRLWPLHLIDIRSKDIFRYKAGDIKKITVTYPRDKNESFTLTISNSNKYDIEPLSQTVTPIAKPISKGAVEQYLSAFENIQAAKVVEKNLLNADTMVSSVPFATFEIVDRNDNIRKLDLYPIMDESARVGLGSEPEFFFAILDNKNFFNCQLIVMKKLFWGYSFFFDR
ncbi:MAG: hypothetical protein KDC31_09900 [Saprospiraceae bacterium]|nr:hypothetical protein [Candidatus Parvibacillus calidus]MBX2936223.1 hypothetical protein [Saprospiraceae bacterium]MBX7178339.1 DUF4340 domain-containing protein [Saprospiraceae bacterium]MCB0591594.1 hypothetical protein [Saprospiraceae bacterium]MCO5283281.1 DUF4340 domain-containing protein [Saprospiraceae bacterium]